MSSDLPSFEEATALVAGYLSEAGQLKPPSERVKLSRAPGRILARPLTADRDQPPFARSTRDGFACRAAEVSAHLPLKIAGMTRAGDAPARKLPIGSAREIMTGAPVPPGADAVAMVEHVEVSNWRVTLSLNRGLVAGENVIARGAQARKGDVLLQAGTRIAHTHVALAATCGHSSLEVFIRPRVAILCTGDEIVPIESSPGPGQIRNSNGPMLAALVEAAGGEPWILPTAGDNSKALDSALAKAMKADLLLITGGVSAGKFDLVEPALAKAAASFRFTGVRIQPGKPLVFGELPKFDEATRSRKPLSRGGKASKARTMPFFGLPGNPVSSAVTFLLFAAPVLTWLAGGLERCPRFALAKLTSANKNAKGGLTRFLPAQCSFGSDGKLPEVALIPWQGSGDLAAMALANCFAVIPENAEPMEPGATVKILLY